MHYPEETTAPVQKLAVRFIINIILTSTEFVNLAALVFLAEFGHYGVYIYIYIYIYVYMYMYTHMSVYTHTYTHTHIHIYTHILIILPRRQLHRALLLLRAGPE